jgi:hypothetical protein
MLIFHSDCISFDNPVFSRLGNAIYLSSVKSEEFVVFSQETNQVEQKLMCQGKYCCLCITDHTT